MNTALDEFNNPIELFPKAKGICKVCGSVLIAHCGELNMWHWQHLSGDRECDPWKEHETPWHREWKNQFPKEWQEKVIIQDGEKHLADVRTDNGVVIEFQNSPISPATIRIREAFYGNMVWVINAFDFKDRLVLRSLVKQELKSVYIRIMHEVEKFESAYYKKIELINDELLDLPSTIKLKQEEINKIVARLNAIEKHNDNPDRLVNHIVEVWAKKSNPNREPLVGRIIDSYKDTSVPVNVFNEFENLKNQEKRKETIAQYLKNIEELETIEINNSLMRFIDFSHVNLGNYKKVVLVEKESKKSLFPNTSTIKTEMEFHNLKFKVPRYEFAIDPQETIQRLHEEREQIVESHEKSVLAISNFKSKLIKEFEEGFNHYKKEWESEREDLISELNELELKFNDLKNQRKELMDAKKSTLETGRKDIEAKHNNDQSDIMKEYKGLYDFQWKNERKSWQASARTIYLDTGETIFEILDDGDTVKKISKEQFLLKYR